MKQICCRFLWISFLLLIAAACKDRVDSNTGLSTPEQEQNLVETSDTLGRFVMGIPYLPTVQDLDSGLLFVFQDVLYLGRFDDREPYIIDNNVDISNIYYNSARNIVIYTTKGSSGSRLKSIDLENLETNDLYDSPGRLHSFDWSPDGEWIAFTEAPPIATPLEPQHQADSVPSPLGVSSPFLVVTRVNGGETESVSKIAAFSAAWLTDNTLLVITLAEDYDHAALIQVDPRTGEVHEIGHIGSIQDVLNGIENPRYRPRAQSVLDDFNLTLAPPSEDKYHGILAMNPQKDTFVTFSDGGVNLDDTCRNLSLVRNSLIITTLPEIIYQTDGQAIYWINLLSDGSILFILRPCDYTEEDNTLILVKPDAHPVVITHQIALTLGETYTLSNDERYLVWIGIDHETNTSFLELTNLQEGISRTLLTSVLKDLSEDMSLDDDGFVAVHWVQ